jgi:hypothetical protein
MATFWNGEVASCCDSVCRRSFQWYLDVSMVYVYVEFLELRNQLLMIAYSLFCWWLIGRKRLSCHRLGRFGLVRTGLCFVIVSGKQ